MFSLPIQIRFNDIDQMGHVNNAVIMEYLDLGKESFFSSRGLIPAEDDFTVMVVHYEVDFRAQIHYRDSITVHTSVESFGNKSFTLVQQVVNTVSGVVCVQCRTVMSGYRRSTASSDVIPQALRQRLSQD